MSGRVRERERKRRLLQASGRKADPSNDEERTATLAQFVERMAPMYPGVVESVRATYEDVRAQYPDANDERVDMLVMLRDLANRREEKADRERGKISVS